MLSEQRAGAHGQSRSQSGMSTALLIFLVSSCILETTLSTTVLSVGPFEVVSDEVDSFLGSDVWDNQPGVPVELHVTAVHLSDRAVIPGMRLDFWAANATGFYSDNPAQGTAGVEFMRGFMITDANGVVKFRTIIPGRYVGRTNHIHMRVRLGSYNVTTQLFFPPEVTAALRTVWPYSLVAPAAWSWDNRNDGIFAAANVVDMVGSAAAGYVANYTLTYPLTGSTAPAGPVLGRAPPTGTVIVPSPPPRPVSASNVSSSPPSPATATAPPQPPPPVAAVVGSPPPTPATIAAASPPPTRPPPLSAASGGVERTPMFVGGTKILALVLFLCVLLCS